jgi:hypothetical protein
MVKASEGMREKPQAKRRIRMCGSQCDRRPQVHVVTSVVDLVRSVHPATSVADPATSAVYLATRVVDAATSAVCLATSVADPATSAVYLATRVVSKLYMSGR